MRSKWHKRRNERGVTMLLVMVMIPLFLIPLVGLAVDATMLYLVQAKLSAAVDGAALGAGRLLGTPADPQEIANEFLNVNFPTGYWGSTNVTRNINVTTSSGTHTINVAATADVPLLFMRVIGQNYSTVAANATATRRDTRVMLVLDRSGSMNTTDPVSGLNVFTTMQSSAAQFVGMFTPGTDELGLVVLSGSAIVAYPTSRPYDPNPRGTGGPDTSFASTSTTGPMFTQISTMRAGGGTGIPEALSLAYLELQKAHYRDLLANGVDNRMNSIVLFTDGVPDSIAVHPNDASALPNSNSLSSSSPCVNNPETASPGTHMAGYIVTPGNPPTWGTSSGLYILSAYDNSQTLTSWLQNPVSDMNSISPATAIQGCSGLGNGSPKIFRLTDLRQIPRFDYYGNSTSGTAYTYSALDYNGTAYDPTRPTIGYQLALASWNATDNVGQTIRSQSIMNPVAIYTIGYTGDGGTDAPLLKRLANTQDSTSYDATQQTGLYIEITSADQLTAAFKAVASNLLRLAR